MKAPRATKKVVITRICEYRLRCLTTALHPRRFTTSLSAVGCKRLLGRACYRKTSLSFLEDFHVVHGPACVLIVVAVRLFDSLVSERTWVGYWSVARRFLDELQCLTVNFVGERS